MPNSSLALYQTAFVLVWTLGFALFIVGLRRRWLARFRHGFLLSLAGAIASAALMAALVIGQWGYLTAKQSVETEIRNGLGNVASIIESEVRADVRDMQGELRQLARMVAPMMDKPDPEALRERLRTIQALQPGYLQLRVIDDDGHVIATSDDEMPERPNRVAVAYALDGTSFVSDIYASEAYKTQVAALAEPVRGRNNTVIGVVSTIFNAQAALSELVSGSRFNESGYAVLVDGEGDVIAHPRPERIGTSVQSYEAVQRAWASKGSGSIASENASGQRRLFFYRAIANPATLGRQPWVLLTEIDEQEEVTILRRLERELLLGVGALVIMSLFLAHQTARSIEQPLTELRQFATRLGGGDLEATTTVSGQDTAGELAASMTQMATGLRERDRVKEVFGRYIATQVSDRILKGDINLGGESRVVTILFSDIRNFTGMAEQMTPQQVVGFLNTYFSEMVEAVFEQGGVLDKFMGDGLMAVFGSLGDQPDHAARAVRAALRMKALLGKFNADRAVTGRPPISIGVGIHTDEVIVGNIGSKRRLEYTVVGDGVNTSSRVQALNKEFGTTILITETTHAALHDEFDCREMPEHAIRGKQRPLKFYEVLSAREAAERA